MIVFLFRLRTGNKRNCYPFFFKGYMIIVFLLHNHSHSKKTEIIRLFIKSKITYWQPSLHYKVQFLIQNIKWEYVLIQFKYFKLDI